MKGARRFAVCGDTHGDKADKGACKAFHEFCKWWKPEVRVHLGDAVDLRFLRKKASDEEKREPVQDDIDAAVDFLRTYKPTHFLRGNHDERLWDAATGDNGPLANYAASLIDELTEVLGGAQVLPYDKRAGVLTLGDLKIIHGYGCGVYATRQAAMIYGNVVMGHGHAIDMASVPGIEPRVGRMIGCLCQLSMVYNRASLQTLRQQHGFGYGIIHANGRTQIWQAEPIGGRWYLPSEVREVKG